MPLHRIFVPKGFYSSTDKAAWAEAITEVYAFLPPFYVIVLFIELDAGNIFVGGKATKRMVRISVEHVARNFTDDSSKRGFMDRYEKVLEPFTKARGIDWEVQIVDCDRLLLNLNGMALPEENTEEERIWKSENRAVSREEMEAMKVHAAV
ncbi:Tautomerase-3 domain-containing protein [Mycena venus]|uniref:Tautomerase-3 domain-containing protein n=1 Tax=Mycena venus TaxID=2733690 RepID=A0A8H7D425_9AGAR|nr:Tautomerase-3 domain-containing protein [Mycena venus]